MSDPIDGEVKRIGAWVASQRYGGDVFLEWDPHGRVRWRVLDSVDEESKFAGWIAGWLTPEELLAEFADAMALFRWARAWSRMCKSGAALSCLVAQNAT